MNKNFPGRNKAMVALYLRGATFQEVGDEFGLTRQRAAQIIRGRTLEKRKISLKQQTRHRKLAEAFARVAEGVSTISEEAEILGILPNSLLSSWSRIGLQMPRKVTPLHGTRHRYNEGCRCAECRESVRMYQRTLVGRDPPSHGTASAYTNYGCRCDACRRAGSAHNRAYRERRKSRERSLLYGLPASRG